MIPSTDPERLRNKQGSNGSTWIFLGRRNKIKFGGDLGEGGYWNGGQFDVEGDIIWKDQ